MCFCISVKGVKLIKAVLPDAFAPDLKAFLYRS
jgi:hypothetical protein